MHVINPTPSQEEIDKHLRTIKRLFTNVLSANNVLLSPSREYPKEIWDLIHSLHYRTRVNGLWNPSIKEFVDFLSRHHSFYESNYRQSRWDRWAVSFREKHSKKTSYRRKSEHKKKEVSIEDENRRAYKSKKCKFRGKVKHSYRKTKDRQNHKERRAMRLNLKKLHCEAYFESSSNWIESDSYNSWDYEYPENEWDSFFINNKQIIKENYDRDYW